MLPCYANIRKLLHQRQKKKIGAVRPFEVFQAGETFGSI